MIKIKSFIPFLILISLFTSKFVSAQEEHTLESKHKKEPSLEIVVSSLFINNPEIKKFDPATELHITYWTSHKWAFGVGYTSVFKDERIGHELAALVSHKPWPFLTVNAGPSFSLPNSHKGFETSAYIEGEFNFKLNIFHFGPLIGSLIGEEFKVFGGIHFGYEF
jgi:hypothetical protein